MNGVSLCARCGLKRSSGGTNRITRRAALLSLLSSGFLAKLLFGAVAVAAVAAVAGVAAMPRSAPSAPIEAVATTQSFLSTDVPGTEEAMAPMEQTTPAADALVESVQAYARAWQSWGDCVSQAARDHSGGSFDPKAACGATPSAAEHGLPDVPSTAPVNARDRATATEDKATDKADATEDKATDKADKATLSD